MINQDHWDKVARIDWHCGVCASDLHTINAGWGKPDYPIVGM
jgi:D-arabinose 1-dehydrogenase-like Zn-dependent alcohol dehydrogenase